MLILTAARDSCCLPLLKDRASRNPNISYQENTWIEQVAAARMAAWIPDLPRRGEISIACDYLVGAIGRKPRLDLLSETFCSMQAEWQQQGRLYLIGDVKNQHYRQAVHRHR